MKTRDLLLAIINKEGVSSGPSISRYAGEWVECLVPIDNDHTAQIRMPKEDFEVLMSCKEKG